MQSEREKSDMSISAMAEYIPRLLEYLTLAAVGDALAIALLATVGIAVVVRCVKE